MNFIAFDLESTDGCFSSGNICEFGYCIADENFNIKEQNNILIRPLNKINSAYYRIKLAYPLKIYYKSPTFIENYSKIGTILQKSDCVVLGHAIHNDIVGINAACKINTIRPFDFYYVDTQILFSIYKGITGVMSLDKIAEEIGVEFNHHRADEDAKLSLLTLKYICEKEGVTFEELIASYEATIGVNEGGVITNFVSKKCISQAPSITSKNSKRRILSMFEPEAVDSSLIDKNNDLYHKRVFINRDIMIEDIDLTRAILNKMAKLGAKLATYVNKCDIYVGEMESNEECNCKVISIQEFKQMLGELEIKSYDDKTILDKYMKEKAERKKLEKIAQINDRNKKLNKGNN